MEAMRGQGGIQMLLTAEQEAQQIVSDARNQKMARLKQAKEEAEREVAAYRASLENEYKKKLSNSTDSTGNNVKKLDEETEIKIKKLNDAALEIRSDVVDMLMKHVTAVKT